MGLEWLERVTMLEGLQVLVGLQVLEGSQVLEGLQELKGLQEVEGRERWLGGPASRRPSGSAPRGRARRRAPGRRRGR